MDENRDMSIRGSSAFFIDYHVLSGYKKVNVQMVMIGNIAFWIWFVIVMFLGQGMLPGMGAWLMEFALLLVIVFAFVLYYELKKMNDRHQRHYGDE